MERAGCACQREIMSDEANQTFLLSHSFVCDRIKEFPGLMRELSFQCFL